MSNCVEFDPRTARITLTSREFLVEEFRTFIQTVPYNQRDVPTDSDDATIAWWFLNPGKNLHFPTNNLVTLTLGEGRSTHTYRDLRGTLHLLTKYYRHTVKKTYNLYIYDESPWEGEFRVETQKHDDILQAVVFPGDAEYEAEKKRIEGLTLKVTPIQYPW